jgi:alkanesulfonate monooxygenase SsuD/methylene tetrahydromethanopterin reductase-like flavin-dependent oxidoreductase (luciferase family)
MKYGFVLPGGTAPEQLERALLAEASGWDGVFVWEAPYGVDPWTLLAAIAARTTRIRLGTMLTPLPWRRPWKLASQVATLDQLSNGRAIVSVGLGGVDPALGTTGDETDLRTRASMLDDGIDLMTSLWQGKMSFAGRHYTIDLEARQDLAEMAKPVQEHIPVWVVAAWPRLKSMRRALRCDGVLPVFMDKDGTYREQSPAEVRDMLRWLKEHRAHDDIDLVIEGETSADDPAAAARAVQPWADAGCTWWIESRWLMPDHGPEHKVEVLKRIAAGPPRIN